MFKYIDGKIVDQSPAHAVIDVGGIGYYIHISLTTYSQIKDKSSAKLYISFQVREDSQTLYGFATDDECQLFNQLISVSGIGPSIGRMMLSSSSPSEIQQAIVSGQVNVIQKIKGIGPKTAQRVILELQDKLKKEKVDGSGSSDFMTISTVSEEATSALIMLGFQKQAIEKVVQAIVISAPNLNVETVIKMSLKKL